MPAAREATAPGTSVTLGDESSLGHAETIPGPGEHIGAFVVERTLGAGAMGVVLLARDAELHRKVAIKLLTPHAGANARAQQRLLREAQSVAALSHPNVVGLHQVGTLGSRVYVVMEFVDGGTLRQWVAAEQREWAEIVDKYRQAAAGLAAAHAAGFVHRDFKPDNVLIGLDGRVRVSDFGLVGADGDSSTTGSDAPVLDVRLTQTGAVLGTPAYMAPEQFLGASVHAAADQFALCVSLYEALHGRRPFAGTTAGALLLSVQEGTILPPLRREVPPRIQRAIERGLSADPLARHASVAALADALDPAAPSRPRSTMVVAAVASVGALALVGGLARWLWPAASTDAVAPADAASSAAAVDCGPVAPVASAAWTPAARDRLGPLVTQGGVSDPAPLLESLDAGVARYGLALGRGRHQLCEQRADLDAKTYTARARCLEELELEFVATLELLAGTEEPMLARDAVGYIGALAPASRCDGVEDSSAPPADGDVARALVEARVHDLSADHVAAGRLAERALELAEAAQDSGASSTAHWLISRAQSGVGDATAAESSVRKALTLARAAGDAGREWRTTLALAATIAVQDARTEEAVAMLAVADAAALRSGERGSWEFDLAAAGVYRIAGNSTTALTHSAAAVDRLAAMSDPPPFSITHAFREHGDALLRSGSAARAEEIYASGIETATRLLGPDHPRRASLLSARATARVHQRDNDAAAADYAEAERILTPDVGQNHAELGSLLLARADLERQRGQLENAAVSIARAIAILEHDPGREEELANALVVLGIVEFSAARHEEARATFARAWTLAQRHPGSKKIAVNHLLSVWGGVELARGDADAALLRHEQALRWLEDKHGPAHAAVAFANANVADMHMSAGRYDEARRGYARALGIRADLELAPDADLVRILAGSARCSAADGDLARAREAAERVHELMGEGLGAQEYAGRAAMMDAEIEWSSGHHALARRHAQAAIEAWRPFGTAVALQVADAERWLAAHGSD
jgi:tetratricopeptide (TPR) repeat protein